MGDTERKRTVLAIDDNEDALEVLRHMIEGQGMRGITASSGHEGVALAKSQKPDLILLDIMMPDMSGYQVCQALKQEPESRDIPIVVLTARKGKHDRSYAATVGAADYLTKPVRPSQLIASIWEHIGDDPLASPDRRAGAAPVLAISSDAVLLHGLNKAVLAHNYIRTERNRYELVRAEDYSRARALIAEQQPVAIIVDADSHNRTPDMTVSRLKTDRKLKSIPLVVIRLDDADDVRFAWADLRFPSKADLKKVIEQLSELIDR